MDTTASATGRSKHVDLCPASARWGQGAQEISLLEPALDLPWSSGGRGDLPHWATEGNSSLCLGAKIHIDIHGLHTSRPTLVPDALRALWYRWHPHSRLGAATGNFPDGTSSTPLKPWTSGRGQHSSESKLGEETSGSPSVPSNVCSVSSSSASVWYRSWPRCSWSWTRACQHFLCGDYFSHSESG